MPTAVAIQCVEVTTPKVPSISGRVVKGSGLMLLMGSIGALKSRVAAHLTTAGAACQPAPDCRRARRCDQPTPRDEPVVDGVAGDAVDQRGRLACGSDRTTSGQRGLKAQPGGGSIGFGISPLTGMRWRPDMARSGTASSSMRV